MNTLKKERDLAVTRPQGVDRKANRSKTNNNLPSEDALVKKIKDQLLNAPLKEVHHLKLTPEEWNDFCSSDRLEARCRKIVKKQLQKEREE